MDNNLQPSKPRRILIIKPSALGDVVTALPVLRGLRRTFGREVQIDWLLARPYVDLLRHEPQLDHIVEFDRYGYARMVYSPLAAAAFWRFCRNLRRAKYDWVIDLQGLFRSGFLSKVTGAQVRAGFAAAREGAGLFYTHVLPRHEMPAHTVDRNIALAKMLGIEALASGFSLTVPEEGREWTENFCREIGDKKFVMVAPATRWKTKLYPTGLWQKVVQELQRHAKVVLISGPKERKFTEPLSRGDGVIDIAGKTNLPQLLGLVAAAKCVVCCDSAVMNIAAALSTPVIALTGPTDPAKTGPYGQLDRVIRSPLACRGCLRRHCYRHSCMESIDPARVVEAARTILDGA